MISVTMYRPFSKFCHSVNRPEEACVLTTLVMGGQPVSNHHFLSQDDMWRVFDRRWLREHVLSVARGVIEQNLPIEVAVIEPVCEFRAEVEREWLNCDFSDNEPPLEDDGNLEGEPT